MSGSALFDGVYGVPRREVDTFFDWKSIRVRQVCDLYTRAPSVPPPTCAAASRCLESIDEMSCDVQIDDPARAGPDEPLVSVEHDLPAHTSPQLWHTTPHQIQWDQVDTVRPGSDLTCENYCKAA